VDPERAAKTSSLAPSVGGGVRLLFQYVFTNAVPAAIADDALTRAVDWAADEANDSLGRLHGGLDTAHRVTIRTAGRALGGTPTRLRSYLELSP
jgi:hypothetical protein